MSESASLRARTARDSSSAGSRPATAEVYFWVVSWTTFQVARTGRSVIASLVTMSIASLGKNLPGQTVLVAAMWA